MRRRKITTVNGSAVTHEKALLLDLPFVFGFSSRQLHTYRISRSICADCLPGDVGYFIAYRHCYH